LSVQSRQINDPGALRAVNESRNRVQSMALIHQNLYRDNDLTGVDMREYIPKLCAELFSAYKMDEDILKLSTDITIKSLDVDTAIPLGLIINELITNALKYAFKPDEEGLLEVKLYEMNQELILEVNDDGKSSSQMENSENPGFGTKMINSFLSKLEGHMTVTQDGGRKVKILIRKFRAV
jgi:two-component sensor histidine kinase